MRSPLHQSTTDATVNACTGFTYVHAIHFHHNTQNSMCMQYFSADELTIRVKSPKWKIHNFSFFVLYLFLTWHTPEFGVGAIEHLRHPYIHNSTTFSSYVHFHTITTAVLKGTLTLETFNKMSIDLYMWWWDLESFWHAIWSHFQLWWATHFPDEFLFIKPDHTPFTLKSTRTRRSG